jgi:hypothetical protein
MSVCTAVSNVANACTPPYANNGKVRRLHVILHTTATIFQVFFLKTPFLAHKEQAVKSILKMPS